MKRLLVLALALTVALLAALAWWHREPEHRPQLQTERAFPPPALQTGQAPAGSPPAWSSVAAQNGEDLKLEFDRAMAQNSAVGWLVAREIADSCLFVLDPMERRNLDQHLEALRAEPAHDLERAARLAHHAQRVQALEELQRRCAGFRGHTVNWMATVVRDLDARIAASDDSLGQLRRVEALARKQKATATQFFGVLAPALLSSDPVLAREAISAVRDHLYDAFLPPQQRAQVPEADMALQMAWEEYTGVTLDGTQRQRLLKCFSLEVCSEQDAARLMDCPPGADPKLCQAMRDQLMDLKAQYLEVLKSGKLRGLVDVRPKGWQG